MNCLKIPPNWKVCLPYKPIRAQHLPLLGFKLFININTKTSTLGTEDGGVTEEIGATEGSTDGTEGGTTGTSSTEGTAGTDVGVLGEVATEAQGTDGTYTTGWE